MSGVFVGIEGRVLAGIAVSDDGETTLRLSFAEGDPHYVTTEGDCCSESWWADVLDAKSAYGGTVQKVEELELPEPDDNRSRQEVDSVYGYAVDTSKGRVTLAFRNSSNGYYGGEAYDTDVPPSAGWKDIKKNDWSA